MLFVFRQGIATSLAFLFSITGIICLQFPRMQEIFNSNKKYSKTQIEQELSLEKVRLQFLKQLPNFGFDNVIANWVFLSFLQYFGDDEIRAKTGYDLSPEYFEVIIGRDPRFIQAYLALSTSISMYAAMPEVSVELTNKGLKSLSPWVPKRSYFVWRYKAIDELLFLGDSQAAKESFANAADWASNHSDEESKQVAYISRGTANYISRKPDSKYARIAAWSMVLNQGVDENTHKRAIIEIETLGGEVIKTLEGGYKIKLPERD